MLVPVIIISVLLPAAMYLFLAAPSPHKKRCRKFSGTLFAHRGLHGEGVPENSAEAFERACQKGYGIELDVQFTKDGRLVVFHDDDAFRMTGERGLLRDKTFEHLRALRLLDSDAIIPTFEETLRLVDARQTLLVEIKTCPNIGALTRATVEALRKYNGPYIVESFNPLCLWHLRRIAPEIVRGQLVCSFSENRTVSGRLLSFALTSLMLNFLARPDFIAYSQNMRSKPAVIIQHRVFKTPAAVWTVTDADMACRLADSGTMPIFENCRP